MISIAIMAHESRAERFDYLLKTLGSQTPMFIDKGKLGEPGNLGPWGNAKRAWKAYDPQAEFHMVVQDDVVFGRDFLRRINLIASVKQNNAICLFAKNGSEFMDKDFLRQYSKPRGWIIHKDLFNSLAVILPTRIIDEMVEYADTCEFTTKRGNWFDDDARIGEYLKHIGMMVVYPLPSLIQHHSKLNSLVGYGHNSKRQGRWFI